MKIFNYIESSFYKALRSSKGVLITWFLLFVLVSAVSIPLKGSLKSAFGSSMITEKLSNGIDPEVFTDLGSTLRTIVSYISSGIFYIFLIGFIANAFFTGGLFFSVRKQNQEFSASEFFRAGASGFWSFLFISLAVTVMIVLTVVMLAVVSAVVLQSSDTRSEMATLITGISAVVLFLLVLPVFLLVADYSRAWKMANGKGSFLKALGSGFSLTFANFWGSYLLMLVMIIVQAVIILVTLKIIPGWHPGTPFTLALLFLVSQFLIFLRLLCKTWRYAGVTSLMEEKQHDPYATPM